MGCSPFRTGSGRCRCRCDAQARGKCRSHSCSFIRLEHFAAVNLEEYPLAIVGTAGRLPSAANHDELWKSVAKGLDCHHIASNVQYPAWNPISSNISRYTQPALFHRYNYHSTLATAVSLTNRDCSMPDFPIYSFEALQTNSGQGLALATAYKALEMSAYVPHRTSSNQLDRIGTFSGQGADEYQEQNMSQHVVTSSMPNNIRA